MDGVNNRDLQHTTILFLLFICCARAQLISFISSHSFVRAMTEHLIPFQRCQIKLRRIDKELHGIKFAGVRTWDEETQEYVERLYDVHDSHQYAAFGHILSLIQDAESLAIKLPDDQAREAMNDIHIRRVVLFKLFHFKISDELKPQEFAQARIDEI